MIRNLLAAALLAGAGVAVAATPASAGCYGTDNTVVVCVEPTGTTLYRDCVHTGSDPCTEVIVPGPTFSCRTGPWIPKEIGVEQNVFAFGNCDL